MDFKLNLKLQNEVDLSISKNEQVVVFTTHQTDSMFMLTFDLKKGGYERKDIKIEINEDGSRMTISSEKPNITSSKGFNKTFIIPEGVVLDKVKARFDQDQSRLIIRMPKLVKGLVAGGIQELKEHVPVPDNDIIADQHEENGDDEIKDSKQEAKDVEDTKEAKKVEEKMYTAPVIAVVGSTLFASLIVLVYTFIRSRNQSTKKSD